MAVDFFCGAGGTTRGLIDANGYVLAGIDKASSCRETYVKNNVNTSIDHSAPEYLEHDLFPACETYPFGEQDELMAKLKRLIPYYRSKAPCKPLLFAICAPCQPFTRLSRKELSRERRAGRERDSNLLREAAEFVATFKPDLVLSENVRGIGDPKFGGVWVQFREALEKLGYLTGSNVVCTSRFGIAQFRKRSILLAVRRESVKTERLTDASGSTLLVPESDPDTEMVSVREAIDHLPPIGAGEAHAEIPNHRTRALSALNLRRLVSAAPGQSNAYMENTKFGDLSVDCHQKVYRKLSVRCFTDVYTRMHPDRPSPTITTKCHSISNGRFGHYDPAPSEGHFLARGCCASVFPEDYVFYPTSRIDPIARMIGNAVPPKLAAFFADYLVKSIEKPLC